jgi:hypothetical protein
MNNIQKSILFLGDSFTWGEGLELYSDTPKWIAERNNHNEWEQLSKIQDNNSVLFRESNRFPSLVSKHFGAKSIVHDNNGGNFHSYIITAEKALFDPDLYIDTIIIQFSHFNRNHLHGYSECPCEYCINSKYTVPFQSMIDIIDNLLNFKEINSEQNYVLNYFQDKLKMSWNNPNFLMKLENYATGWYLDSFNYFVERYLDKWVAGGKRKIYYIDSWDTAATNIIKNNTFVYNNMIPLIGPDGEKYILWDEWVSTFEYKSIADEFPKTLNHHPTLLQHKFLANSIIQHLIENNYE